MGHLSLLNVYKTNKIQNIVDFAVPVWSSTPYIEYNARYIRLLDELVKDFEVDILEYIRMNNWINIVNHNLSFINVCLLTQGWLHNSGGSTVLSDVYMM